MYYIILDVLTTLFLFIFRKVSIVKKQTSQTVEKEFQAGRDLIEDEFAEENRVKVEVYAYYAKSIDKNILCRSGILSLFTHCKPMSIMGRTRNGPYPSIGFPR